MKQKLIEVKWETDSSMTIVEDFSTSLSIMDRTTRQKIIEDMEELKNNKWTRPNRHAIHPTTTEYIFLSRARGTFFRIDHMLDTHT